MGRTFRWITGTISNLYISLTSHSSPTFCFGHCSMTLYIFIHPKDSYVNTSNCYLFACFTFFLTLEIASTSCEPCLFQVYKLLQKCIVGVSCILFYCQIVDMSMDDSQLEKSVIKFN